MNRKSSILLSIITINKNNYKGLKVTSESIHNHFENEELEWIVVDGGSEDDSLNYLRGLTGGAIQKFETELGLYESMNYGAERATGKYLVFMNSGDKFTEMGIDAALNFAAKNNNDWIIAESVAVDSEYAWQWDWPTPSVDSLGFKLGFRSFCHQSTFVKREIFNRLNGFETDSLFSDWQMSLKLAELSMPLNVNCRTSEYLVGGLSSQSGVIEWALQTGKLRRRTNSAFLGSKTLDLLITPFIIFYMIWKKRR